MCDFKFRHVSVLARKWMFYIYHDKNLPMSAGWVLLSVTLDSVPGTLNIVSHDQKLWEALQIYRTGPGHSSLTFDQVRSSEASQNLCFQLFPFRVRETVGEGLSIATAGSSGHLILQNSELFPGGDNTILLVLSLLPGIRSSDIVLAIHLSPLEGLSLTALSLASTVTCV